MTDLLDRGDAAPDFTITGPDGPVSLSELLANGPAVLAFFKTTCPTCKMAFPVFGEVARRFGNDVPVVAVAQDPLADAVRWINEFDFDGPVLDDAAGKYAVSDLYGVRSVPTVFFVGSDGRIEKTIEGWDRQETNGLVERLAAVTGGDPARVSTKADGRPPAKPG